MDVVEAVVRGRDRDDPHACLCLGHGEALLEPCHEGCHAF
jgi:hypothetical protein